MADKAPHQCCSPVGRDKCMYPRTWTKAPSKPDESDVCFSARIELTPRETKLLDFLTFQNDAAQLVGNMMTEGDQGFSVETKIRRLK